MANAAQLAILKQGVKVWNKWREENPEIVIYLAYADLRGINLENAELYNADMRGANLIGVNLCNTKLNNSNLDAALVNKAQLVKANLEGASLRMASLIEANLQKAILGGVNLYGAYLNGAKLNESLLINSNLDESQLDDSDFSYATFGKTIVRNVNLGNVIGLNRITHFAPSTLDIDVFQITQSPLPKSFTRGCGWQDWQVKAMELQKPELTPDQVEDILYEVYNLRNGAPSQLHNLFISHSRKDAAFIEHIGKVFEQRNILYWLDVRDAVAGPLEKQIDRAIRLNETFLLVLSKHSCESDWVELEIETARALEKESKRHIICPIALDEEWKNGSLSKRLVVQLNKYNVLDFSRWQEPDFFAQQFEKLLKGLHLYYMPS